MRVGDLVRCRPRTEDENYDAWLGLIIGGRGDVEEVNHTPQELVLVNENR